MNRKQFFVISSVTDLNRGCQVCDPVMRSIAGANNVSLVPILALKSSSCLMKMAVMWAVDRGTYVDDTLARAAELSARKEKWPLPARCLSERETLDGWHGTMPVPGIVPMARRPMIAHVTSLFLADALAS